MIPQAVALRLPAMSLKRPHLHFCQEWEESRLEQQQQEHQHQKVEDRKKIREEKARLARLAVIQVTFLTLKADRIV